MNALDLQSEKYSPTGNISSRGARRVLGRPRLNALSVLIREAGQNSWDARSSDGRPVRFGLTLWTATEAQKTALREVVFADAPKDLGLQTGLRKGAELKLLCVWDRGTVGLGGPTRADDYVPHGASDFVEFFRNVGTLPERAQSGGTYGYGKAAFYQASKHRTICVHTRCMFQDVVESRLIAAALGNDFDRGRARYTGRHWWGRNIDGVVDPIINQDADTTASSIGLPPFDGKDLGSSFLIIEPILDGRSGLQSANLMIETLLWYFWPKMLPDMNGTPAMEFHAAWNSDAVPIPAPQDFPPLNGFVAAMKLLGADAGSESNPFGEVRQAWCLRPKQELGSLALQRFPVKSRVELDTGPGDDSKSVRAVPFQGLCHHVALMRQPELVIKYVECPPLGSDQIEYAGVFKVVPEMDSVFAEAEPPTHDDWVAEPLDEKVHKTFVRVARRRIEELTDEFVKPPSVSGHGGWPTPLAGFSRQMGSLLPGQRGVDPSVAGASPGKGTGAGPGRTSTAGGRKRQGRGARIGRAGIELLGDGALTTYTGADALAVEFNVVHAAGSTGTLVSVKSGAVLDGAELEDEPPVGSPQPTVLAWEAHGRVLPASSSMFIPSDDRGPWKVIVSLVDDAPTGVDLRASARHKDAES